MTVYWNCMMPCLAECLLLLLDERHPKTSTLCDLYKLVEEADKLSAHCSFLHHNILYLSLQNLQYFQN